MDLDAQVHTHADEDDPYFSDDDIQQFASDFADGITKQILLSKNNMTVLDMTDVKDVNGLLDALAKTEHNFEALATTADKFGAKYINKAFNEITPQGLVKMLGIKGIESKYTEAETRNSAVKGMLEEDAKVAADMLQESTGRAVKKTVERVGAELMTTTEKTDAKGNKTWSKQISDKYTKAALATNKAFTNLGLENEFGIGTEAQIALVEYQSKFQDFLHLVEEFKKNPEQDGLQERFNTLLPQLDTAEDKLNKLIVSKDKFLNGKEAVKIFAGVDLAHAGDSLKQLATDRYTKNGLNPGDNIAFNGLAETPNGTRLLIDVLKDGTIKQYALEVDRATGQVKEFMTAETALANAFQNVNKAMRQNEVVQANVAIGDDAYQQMRFLYSANSPEWNAYKAALAEMEQYVADIWNEMVQGGRGATQIELDYIMALSEKVLTLGKDVQSTSVQFKNFWAQNPEDVTALSIDIKNGKDVPSRDEQVRAAMEKFAQTNADASNAQYKFASFDNDTLKYQLTDIEGNVRNMTLVCNELYGQISNVSDKSVAKLDPLVAKAQKYEETIQNALSLNYLDSNDPVLKAFQAQQAVVTQTIADVKAGIKTYEDLEQARQKAADLGADVKKQINQNKKLYVGTKEINSVNRQRDKIIGISGIDFETSDIADVQAYDAAYKQLIATHKQFADNNTLYNTKNQERLRQQAVGVQNLGKQLLTSINQAEKLQQLVNQSGVYIDRRGYQQDLGGVSAPLSAQEADAKNLQETMRSYVANTLKQGNIENVKFNVSTQQLTYTFRTSKDTVADMVVQYNAATNALYAYNKQEKESLTGFAGFFKGMKGKLASLWQYTMGITSIHRVLSELRRGVQYIREIDSALTELKKVTNETEKTYDKFLDTAAKTADKVGSTIAEVVSSTSDFARLGYDLQSAAKMAESAQILMNVSEFTDIASATDSLISAIQAFSYTADESLHVVDIMNTIGNRYAISTADLASSLTRSSAALVAAGNSMEEAVALTAAANTIIQDADSVGNALKTVSMRIRGTSVKELEEAGEDTDGVIENTSKLYSKIKALTAVGGKEGISILGDDGKYLNTYEILTQIAERWDEITKMGNDAALLELIAGKTRGSVVAALLQQPEILKDAYEDALNAEGSALKENERYLDSIQGKIDLFNNATQTMWQNTLDDEVVKWFVDLGTQIIKLIDNVGLLRVLFVGLGGITIQKYFGDALNLDATTRKLEAFQKTLDKTANNPKRQKKYQQTLDNLIDERDKLEKSYKQAQKAADLEPGNKKKKAQADKAKSKYEKYNSVVDAHNETINLKNTLKALTDKRDILTQQLADATTNLNKAASTAFGTTVEDAVKIDTASIDAQITDVKNKLFTARKELTDGLKSGMKKADFDAKKQEIHDLEVSEDNLKNLKQAREQYDDVNKSIAEVNGQINTTNMSMEKLGKTSKITWTTLKDGAKSVGKAVWSTVESMLMMYAIMTAIELIGKGVKLLVNATKDAGESAEEAQAKFEELESELSSTESEIKSLESELKNTKEQIDDLKALGSLSFTEQEDLKRLQQTSAELERQIALKKTLQESQQKGVNAASVNATDKYLDTSFNSDQSKSERQEEAEEEGTEKGRLWGLLGGAALGIGLAVAGVVTGGVALAIAGGVAAAGGLIGGAVGSALEGKEYDKEETVGDNISQMEERRQELIDARDQAYEAYMKGTGTFEDYDEAEKNLSQWDETMAKHMAQIQENYNAMDWETSSERQKEAMKSQADMLSKYAIVMKSAGAKENAISRIFSGAEASEDLKQLDAQFKELAANGEDANFFDELDSELPQKVKDRLDEIGISLTDLKYYYLDWAKAEEEVEGNVYDTVQVVSNLTDGISSLKGAFDEFAETGLVTAKTLVDLNETFGNLGDAWKNYVTLMSSGTATTQQAKKATEELLEVFLNKRLAQGPINDMGEYLTLVGQLQSLGVTNAATYIEGLQRTSAISEIAKQEVARQNRITELDNADSWTKAEGQEYQELKTTSVDDYIKEIEAAYGIQLSKEEKSLLIQKAITVEKAKQAALEASTKEAEYQTAKRNKEEAKEKFDKGEITKAEYDAVPVAVEPELDADEAEAEYERLYNELQGEYDKLNLEVDIDFNDMERISGELDKIQDSYSTLKDAITEYNENGFLTLDNLQALLALEPEYLACLQMENGQLSLNQLALQNMVRAKLAEAKATVVQSAMKQLNELAARKETQAINGSATAASNAIGGLGAYAGALGTVAQEAIKGAGAVTAFNAAVAGAQANELVKQSEIDAILSSMDTQLQMIDDMGVALAANFNTIMGYGGDDDIDTGGGGKGDSALDRIRNKYEGEISNLDNQITYLQNEIDLLEAQDEAVSKSYYEEQKARQQEKLDLYEQERQALLELYSANPTQETAEAIWEVEHAIQETTLAIVECEQAMTDLYVKAFDKLIEAFDNSDDFLSDQQNYLDKYQELMELMGKPKSANVIQAQYAIEADKMADNIAELNRLRETLAESDIEEGGEEWVDMQDKIRATEEAILDNQIALEQYRNDLKQLSADAFELVRNAFSSKDQYFSNQQDYMQGYADLLEAQGIDVPTELYEELIAVEQQKRANNVANLVDARQDLADIEAAGYTAADEEWQDAYQKVVELEKAIQDNDIAMVEWEKTIRDMDFENFERFISRLDDISSEIDNLRGLFDDDDVAFKDGTWTEEGITSLGLAYHQMELAQQKSQEYAEKIDELNEAYKNGEMSEQEYYERLKELKDGQWDAIGVYEDAKDALVDMEEARIDMIEEGINEEIEAYEELIEVKKEELDAERDLYNFKKDIKKQTKDLAALDRRIASLSGSTADADIAELRKLQAERREMQEGLDDTIYNHAMDSQSKALDDEMTTYRETREDYLETLRDTLDDTTAIIQAKITELLTNADVVLNGLNTTSAEYGITLSDSLMLPWTNASNTALEFKTSLDENLPLLTNEDGVVTVFGNTTEAILTEAFGAGSTACTAFKTMVQADIATIKTVVENASSSLTARLKFPWDNTTKKDGPIATFSQDAKDAINGAVNLAQNKANSMKSYLASPWDTSAMNTWSEKVNNVLQEAHRQAAAYGRKISAELNIDVPSYSGNYGGGGSGSSGRGSSGSGNSSGGGKTYTANAKLFALLKLFKASGTGSSQAQAQDAARDKVLNMAREHGIKKGKTDAWLDRQYGSWYAKVKFYAKGTAGTKQDGWAVTDESWIGEEITLAAGKNGQLQYLKKGSAVLPADISANLVEWGKLNPNMLNMSGAIQGVNLMSNYVNKPEIKLDIENLLKVDRVDKDTLPDLEKLMDKKLDNFARQLNYSIKKFK